MIIHTPRRKKIINKKPIIEKKEEVKKEVIPKKVVIKKEEDAAPVKPTVEPETAKLDELDEFSEWDFND